MKNQWHILKLIHGRRFRNLKMRSQSSQCFETKLRTCLYLDIFYLFGSYFVVYFKSIFSNFGAPYSDFLVNFSIRYTSSDLWCQRSNIKHIISISVICPFVTFYIWRPNMLFKFGQHIAYVCHIFQSYHHNHLPIEWLQFRDYFLLKAKLVLRWFENMWYFGKARRDDVVTWKHFFFGFRCPTASISQYVSYSSKKIYYLGPLCFESRIFINMKI